MTIALVGLIISFTSVVAYIAAVERHTELLHCMFTLGGGCGFLSAFTSAPQTWGMVFYGGLVVTVAGLVMRHVKLSQDELLARISTTSSPASAPQEIPVAPAPAPSPVVPEPVISVAEPAAPSAPGGFIPRTLLGRIGAAVVMFLWVLIIAVGVGFWASNIFGPQPVLGPLNAPGAVVLVGLVVALLVAVMSIVEPGRSRTLVEAKRRRRRFIIAAALTAVFFLTSLAFMQPIPRPANQSSATPPITPTASLLRVHVQIRSQNGCDSFFDRDEAGMIGAMQFPDPATRAKVRKVMAIAIEGGVSSNGVTNLLALKNSCRAAVKTEKGQAAILVTLETDYIAPKQYPIDPMTQELPDWAKEKFK